MQESTVLRRERERDEMRGETVDRMERDVYRFARGTVGRGCDRLA